MTILEIEGVQIQLFGEESRERFSVIMETNTGGHFDQPQMRVAKGIRKLLQA